MASSAVGIRVLRTVRELREWRHDIDAVPRARRPRRRSDEVEHAGPSEGFPRATVGIGLVPTMGALHEGHLTLVERAVRESERAIASIFVNPTQFGPGEDYSAYPRDEMADLALLERAGCAAAFIPGVDEMYPPGDDTRVVPGGIGERLEGAARPGHFTGVCTVVAKLFGMATPARAYFSHKDFQQLRVIQTMVRDLAMPVRIVPFDIVREADGLAMSSRNAYLTPDERVRALALSRALSSARDAWDRGERDAVALRSTVERIAGAAGRPEYVSVADPVTLREIDGNADRAVISLACRVGRARLIDNVLLGMSLDELAALSLLGTGSAGASGRSR